jgi:hypothetical protein
MSQDREIDNAIASVRRATKIAKLKGVSPEVMAAALMCEAVSLYFPELTQRNAATLGCHAYSYLVLVVLALKREEFAAAGMQKDADEFDALRERMRAELSPQRNEELARLVPEMTERLRRA